MQTNSNNCISSLPNSFPYNIIINIFNSAAFCAELVLSFLLRSICLICSILVFFYMISESVSLCQVNGLVLILLLLNNVLMNIFKSSAKFILRKLLAITCCSFIILLLLVSLNLVLSIII